HRKAIAAIDAGEFVEEISPYPIVEHVPDLSTHEIRTVHRQAAVDEGPRRDTTLETRAKLKPVFNAKGSVTAGNSSQTPDGAGAVILASEAAIQRYGLRPLARFLGFAVVGVPPEVMGI